MSHFNIACYGGYVYIPNNVNSCCLYKILLCFVFISFLKELMYSFKLGDRIELLILKAKRNLEHCTEELPKSMKKDDSPCSLDKLEAERSWENIPVTL